MQTMNYEISIKFGNGSSVKFKIGKNGYSKNKISAKKKFEKYNFVERKLKRNKNTV